MSPHGEDLLLALSAILRHRIEHSTTRQAGERGWGTDREYSAALDALVAVDLLDRRAAARWRRVPKQLAADAQPPVPPQRVEPELRARVRSAFREQLPGRWVVVTGDEPRRPTRADHEGNRRRAVVASAAAEIGLLSWSEAVRYGGMPGGVGSVAPAFATFEQPAGPGQPGALEKVIGADELPPGIVALELYEGRLLVRGRGTGGERGSEHVQLHDDLGTNYVRLSGSGTRSWVAEWMPGVPADSTRLRVTLGARSTELKLRPVVAPTVSAEAAALRHLEESYAALWLTYVRERFKDALNRARDPHLAKVELLAKSDVVDAAAAAEWRDRFARLGRRWPRAAAEPIRAAGRAHLESLLADDADSASLSGALLALAGTLVFSEAEVHRWRGRAGLEHEVDYSSPDGAAFDDETLVRTITAPNERAAGFRVTVAELLSGGIRVHWQDDPSAARRQDRQSVLDRTTWDMRPRLQLADNLGTRYYPHMSSWQDYGYELDERAYGWSTFFPAVPERARRLSVRVGRDRMTIPLR